MHTYGHYYCHIRQLHYNDTMYTLLHGYNNTQNVKWQTNVDCSNLIGCFLNIHLCELSEAYSCSSTQYARTALTLLVHVSLRTYVRTTPYKH